MTIAPKSSEDGFSLIETLVAFAIMVAVLAVLLPGIAILPSRSRQIMEQIQATDYAYSRLVKIGRSTRLQISTRTGDYQSRWTWREEVLLKEQSSNGGNIVEVRVIILDVFGKVELARVAVLKVLE